MYKFQNRHIRAVHTLDTDNHMNNGGERRLQLLQGEFMKIKEIRALSITQPWAECILSEGKNVENRSWITHQRGYVAIHASSSYDSKRFKDCSKKYKVNIHPDEVDYGAIVGFAKLVDVVTGEDLTRETKKWFEGEYGFVFEDIIKLKKPVEVKGTLNFWKLKGKILDACLRQLNETDLKKLASSCH